MSKEKTWVVTTGGDRPIQDIAKELVDAGLKEVQVLQEIGSIIGSAEEDTAAKLRKVQGVVDISPDILAHAV